MSKSSSISIGIPFYNAQNYIEESIKSILIQTYQNWELILIDDGSTDKSLEIANSFAKKDSRIRVISDGQNKKLPARLNQIIQEARYDYIARMDADDLISPLRLEKQLNFLKENEHYDLVSTGIFSLKNDLSLVGYRGTKENKIVSLSDAILGTTGIIHASIIAKKSWYVRNLYNENNKLAEDYELWLNAFLKDDLKVGFIKEPLYYYREDQNIKLKKLLQAYTTQIEIIKNIDSKTISLDVKNKYIKKFSLKKYIVNILFLTKLDFLLHKRRVDMSNNLNYQQILKKNLSLINSWDELK